MTENLRVQTSLGRWGQPLAGTAVVRDAVVSFVRNRHGETGVEVMLIAVLQVKKDKSL